MYQQSNKKAAVSEIQKYLFFLSDTKYQNIPRIPIDGIFDEETKKAVVEFQKTMSILPTGIVDFQTFTALYEEYKDEFEKQNTDICFLRRADFPIKENDQNENVRILHSVINVLKKTYPQITDTGNGAYFSSRTVAALRDIRNIFSFPGPPELDQALYRRIISEIVAQRQLEQIRENLF